MPAAPIFDPLSARLAEVGGWTVGKLSGSIWKAANLALPDDVDVTNVSDLAETCARIRSAAPALSLIVDADDAGGTVLRAFRTVRDLERAGVSGIEIDDTTAPSVLGGDATRHSILIDVDVQCANLRSAVAAREDPLTVVTARTEALTHLPLDQALARVRAYASTGVDAIMLPRIPSGGRAHLKAVHQETRLPLCVLGVGRDEAADDAFLAHTGLRVQYLGTGSFRVAVKAITDYLAHLKAGGEAADLRSIEASPELVRAVNRFDELASWQDRAAASDA